MQELEVAIHAAQVGGEVLSGYFREGEAIRTKQACDLVSDADIESEQAIASVIQKAFPEHAILGEEEFKANIDAEHLWIVDPLDGTTNFAHDIPHFGVSVAYYRKGEPIVGVVLNPARNELFRAIRGEGSFAVASTGIEEPLSVSPANQLADCLVGVGFYYDRGAMMEATLSSIADFFRRQIHGIRRFGTASLDLVHVASGLYGAFFEYELSPWDFAAGRLIVEEAGGQVSTCQGQMLRLEKTSVLASNSVLHDSALQIVSARHP